MSESKKSFIDKLEDIGETKITSKQVLFVLFILFIFWSFFGSIGGGADMETGDSVDVADNSTMAYVQAKNFVRPMLKSPSTADFPFLGEGERIGEDTYEVSSYVDAQNSYGGTVRNVLTYDGGDPANQVNWTLESLIFDGERVY